jgi:hypothetical protein
MPRDDLSRDVEGAVDVTESAEADWMILCDYLFSLAGTSRSALSQMKSLLL